jgi:hypothetical protein
MFTIQSRTSEAFRFSPPGRLIHFQPNLIFAAPKGPAFILLFVPMGKNSFPKSDKKRDFGALYCFS